MNGPRGGRGQRSPSATSFAKSADADATSEVLWSKISSEDVMEWLADVTPKRGPRWPILPDNVIEAVAHACNRERYDRTLRQEIASNINQVRAATRALRPSIDTLISELPALIKVYQSADPASPEIADRDFLVNLRPMLYRLREIVDPSRHPGGQPRPYVAFACRVAVHIRLSLEQQGVGASFKPDRPLIRFVAHAVEAVFGEAPNLEALAMAVKRHFAKLG